MPAKISGEGYNSLQLGAMLRDAGGQRRCRRHGLPVGGFYRQRAGGESHAYSAQLMHLLQNAVATDSYSTYLQFSRGVRELPPVYLRDLLDFNWARKGIPIDSRSRRSPRSASAS
jgi:glutamate synthase (NADPH/NADH) large chain